MNNFSPAEQTCRRHCTPCWRTTMKTIAIGADDAAIELKNVIKKLLEEKEYVVTDYTNDAQNDRPMYPDVA
ncbi:RpiB/LacA/LacB family sugar-phosphate isomerase, partial [Pantoea endophytica]|uniref:RpiB/LacA/LacB family sugar-phosphate isomerase n=1 Tax=Pantoea endophytica TaxID=92488 RepID=UPI00289AE065